MSEPAPILRIVRDDDTVRRSAWEDQGGYDPRAEDRRAAAKLQEAERATRLAGEASGIVVPIRPPEAETAVTPTPNLELVSPLVGKEAARGYRAIARAVLSGDVELSRLNPVVDAAVGRAELGGDIDPIAGAYADAHASLAAKRAQQEYNSQS